MKFMDLWVEILALLKLLDLGNWSKEDENYPRENCH
jgi:hypothetical protein